MSEMFTNALFGNITVSQIVVGVFLLIFLNQNIKNTSQKVFSFNLPLLLLSFLSLTSILWSPYPFIAFIFSIKVLFLANILMISSRLGYKQIISELCIKNLAKAVIAIVIVGQLIGLSFGITVYQSDFGSAGLADNQSIIAAEMLFALPALLLGKINWKIDLPFYVAILVSIMLTLRRSSLLAFLLVLISIFLINFVSSKISIRKKMGLTMLTGFGLIIFYWITTGTNLGGELMTRLEELDPTKGGTASGRYDFQLLGLLYSLKRDFIPFLLGDGFGASIKVNLINGFPAIGMHSDFLDILVGLGILGLVLFITFLFQILILARHLSSKHLYFNSVISFLVAVFAIALFTGGFFEINTILGYISLGFIYGSYQRAKKIKVYTTYT